jgi:hypothetical protein
MELISSPSCYLVVAGELAGPAASPPPPASLQRLEGALAEVSRLQRRHLRTPLEWSGEQGRFLTLLRHPSAFCELVTSLEAETPGLALRWGLGWGTLHGELRPRVHGMGGPCFDRARSALSTTLRDKAWASCLGFAEEHQLVLNGLLRILGAVRMRWKPKQRETIALARTHARRKDVARLRGVSEATVSRSLDGALFAPVLAAESALSSALALFTEQPASPS